MKYISGKSTILLNENGDKNMNNYTTAELQNAQRIEKNALRITVTKLGFLFILYDLIFMYITSQIFAFGYYAISTKKFSLNPGVVNNFLRSDASINSSAFRMLFSCFVILLSIIMVLITARLMGIRVLSSVKISRQNIRLGLIAYPVGLLINTILTTITSIITKIFSVKGTTIPTADFSVDKASASAIILTILYLVVVAPIGEEIVFRGLILKALSPFGRKNAIVLSAVLFALMHKNIPQAVGAFVIGIIFATVDTKANSIVPSIIMHSLNNMLPCLLNINASVNSNAITVIYTLLVYAIILAGITIAIGKGRQLFSLKAEIEREKSALPEYRKRLEIFLNPVILIYIGILVFSIIANIIAAN